MTLLHDLVLPRPPLPPALIVTLEEYEWPGVYDPVLAQGFLG